MATGSTLSADEFAQFFQQKVEDVRATTASTPSPASAASTATELINSWTQVQPDEVVRLISQAPNKTCQLDPAPAWIVKEFSHLLAPYIALLFYKSLESGCYSQSFKHAIVLPLLNKNSTGDQTANVNFFTTTSYMYSTYAHQTELSKFVLPK